jgi:hypothetical protein
VSEEPFECLKSLSSGRAGIGEVRGREVRRERMGRCRVDEGEPFCVWIATSPRQGSPEKNAGIEVQGIDIQLDRRIYECDW